MKQGREGLLSVQEARQRIFNYCSALPEEEVPLLDGLDRVLAHDLVSPLDLPPFPNSSMDGFAVRSEDIQTASSSTPVHLEVIEDIPAGQVPTKKIGSMQAARIMTGAQLPPGADCVVPVEITDFDYRQTGLPAPESVGIMAPVQSGSSVRPYGEDVRKGEMVLTAGRRLQPMDIGFLSILGIPTVQVHQRPLIGIFSTGDELLSVDEPLQPGKIRDANTYSLGALAHQYGAETLTYGIVPDRADAVEAYLDRAYQDGVDLILTSAGVSVGALDYVRSVVEKHGSLEFWRVNMRPGKPLAFGEYRQTLFVGLPGNPVSAYVTFLVFVIPALEKMAGLPNLVSIPTQRVILEKGVESDGRESYLRAVVFAREGEKFARLTGHQGSGNLLSLVQANALLIIPSGVKSLPPGSLVDAWVLGTSIHG